MSGSATAPPSVPRGARRRLALDAALRVLARRGARGLTHRAVDREAGLAEGSTSNHFRTRDALLEATLAHHLALDLEPAAELEVAPTLTGAEATTLLAAAVVHLQRSRDLLVARYELFLESTRRPALAAELGPARARFAELAERVLAATGCDHPVRHGRQLVACIDGLAFDGVLGGPAALTNAEVEETIARLLADC